MRIRSERTISVTETRTFIEDCQKAETDPTNLRKREGIFAWLITMARCFRIAIGGEQE